MITLTKSIRKCKTPAPQKKNRLKRLVSMGRASKGVITELYSPIDSTNRFINLALQSIGENPQGRQFLLESKEGVRKMAAILKKLNNYAMKMEAEIRQMEDYETK